MTKSHLKLLAGIFASHVLVLSTAFGHIFQMPETNTVSATANSSNHAMSGQYLDYTSVLSAVAASSAANGSVKILIQEQEDWRGQFSIVPALIRYLESNPTLLGNAQGKYYDSDRWQFESVFSKVVPATKSYSLIMDLNTPESRADFEKLIRAIAPGILLSECGVDNMLTALAIR